MERIIARSLGEALRNTAEPCINNINFIKLTPYMSLKVKLNQDIRHGETFHREEDVRVKGTEFIWKS